MCPHKLKQESYIHATEIIFHHRATSLSGNIWVELKEELLLLCIERSQLRKIGHVIGIPHGCIPFSNSVQLVGNPGKTQNSLELSCKSMQAMEYLGISQNKIKCESC
ncbi:hypothetical protein ILYODFUR_001363 [Ilyodon furcidens]|uniref:Uncharacterized protein n=1 Tax=Ilyodon furcidens TaxID=33524 RepID=A0ABV0T818_9TELE